MWLFFFPQVLDGQLLRRERQGHRKSATLTLLSTNLSSGHQVGTRGGQQGQQAVQPPLPLLPSPIPPSGRKEEKGCPSTPYPHLLHLLPWTMNAASHLWHRGFAASTSPSQGQGCSAQLGCGLSMPRLTFFQGINRNKQALFLWVFLLC